MLRWLYRGLVRLHPYSFRRRFSEELLEIFDEVSGTQSVAWLFADVFLSVSRQWLVRSEFRRPMMATADSPIFRSLENYKPRPTALLNGGFISAAALFAVVLAMGHGREGQRVFVIGVHHSSPHLLPLDRTSFAEGDLNATVKLGAEPADPWREIASVYFKVIRVLGVLDLDQDFIISPREIANAPAALQKLDVDHDGKLSPEECGFSLNAAPDFVKRARLEFMRANPVLAALDADHDGEISQAEILSSAAALRKLDKNSDGSLTPDEVIPDKLANQAMLILSRLDTNHDGVISVPERYGEDAARLRTLLDAADRNHDGIVTMEELTNELRLHEEQRRQFDSAVGSAGLRHSAK
jgi:Ca2+-binding EF-hand superfamily protein